MRKRISGLMAFVCLLVAAASARAGGTTVTTFTPFADMDFAAQGYMDLITAWEDETGNMVEDYSGLEDDLFMEQMQEMVTAGRADLVVVPLGSGLTKDQLVSVDELLAAAPDCDAKRMDAMAERDGSVLLAPVRFNWEALYVNADVLEANGVAVPTNYDELIIACAIITRWRMPPESSCGYLPHSPSGSGRPTSESACTTRSWISAFPSFVWIRRLSPTCRSIFNTGFKEVIGS